MMIHRNPVKITIGKRAPTNDPEAEARHLRQDFFRAFAMAAWIDWADARGQWAAFTRELSDAEREAIELGGSDAGDEQGERFKECFPPEGIE
jgi:hypothetical protein